MSLDVYLTKIMPTEVYSSNITHNLSKMANAVTLSNGFTLYDILWRPDECVPPYTHAGQLSDLLHEGWKELHSDPLKYKQYNPENEWGSYEGFVKFVKQYRDACIENPDADINVSR